MAIKENIDYIKKELNSQEQILQNAIKGEMFLNKHKKTIISIFVIIVVFVCGFFVKQALENKKINDANIAYNTLLKNPNNHEVKEQLKSLNPSLFALFALQKSSDLNSTDLLHEALSLEIDPILKEIISEDQNSDIFANYNALKTGYEALKDNKIQRARLEFAKIKQNQNMQNVAKNLEHYQGQK